MKELTFIDIFSGIGGFRLGFERAGFRCIGYCEKDKFARKSYQAMYDTKTEWRADDIRETKSGEIPRADCWTFGFPCQDISLAGKKRGISAKRSGLYFEVIRLIQGKEEEDKPEWLVAENVRSLLSINRGWDFARVLIAMDAAGYDAEWQVLNSRDFGVPQNRERVYIIGHLRRRGRKQILPIAGRSEETARKEKEETQMNPCGFTVSRGKIRKRSQSTCVDANYWKGLDNRGQRTGIIKEHDGPQGYEIYSCEGISPTLRAQEPHFITKKMPVVRKLTPKECFRLQGFPDEIYKKARDVCSDTQMYKQIGNAVTVPVAEAIAEKIINA